MLEFEMRPVIDIWSLADALEERYGWGIDAHDLCQLMFDDNYVNDCFKSYYFANDGCKKNSQEELICKFLREQLPAYCKRILVDVSW